MVKAIRRTKASTPYEIPRTDPPKNKNPGTGSHNLRHYCRRCEETFETADGIAAHTWVRRHQRDETRKLMALDVPENRGDAHYYIHPVDIGCDNNCHLKAQPEEIRTNQRIYGAQTKPTVTLILPYEEAFPPEADND